MRQDKVGRAATAKKPLGGLAGWLLERWQGRGRTPARLAVLERIALAPRQSLALVEAEGRRFLVATSAEGTPAFYPLEGGETGTGNATGNGNERDEQSNERRKDATERPARATGGFERHVKRSVLLLSNADRARTEKTVADKSGAGRDARVVAW